MKTIKFLFFSLLLAFGWSILLQSCKEKNEEYPVHNWSEYFYETPSIAPRDISAILYENDHSIWLGAKGNEGLLHQDGYKWNVYDKTNTGIDFDSITAITRDGNGLLWIGWRSGLANYNGSSWQKISKFDGLCVSSLVVEGIGNIKAGIKGMAGGIAAFANNEWIFYTLTNSDIPSETINSVSSDHEQLLWMATADKGIIRLKNDMWEMMSDEIALLSNDFTCITTAPDGSVWAGSNASQLINFKENAYTEFSTGTSKPITSILVAQNGSVWCGTSGAGLVKFDGSGWISYTKENAALPSNTIYCMSNADPGNLLFSIPGGQVLMIKQ
jgi:ligand-binding sensor domain-containing protein